MNTRFYIVCIAAGVILNGCSTVKKKYEKNFENKTVVSTGQFADSTIAMLSNLNLQFRPDDAVLTRRFMDPSAAPEKHAKELHDDMLERLSAIVWYSVKLVDINQTGQNEVERVAMYGEYLRGFKTRLLAKGRCNEADFDKTIEEVLKQEALLDALRVAQPLLETMVTDGALQVGDLIDSVKALALALDGRIDQDFAKIIHYRKTLQEEKFNILEAYEIIYEAYRSPTPDLSKLRDSGVMWEPDIIPEGTPTREDLQAIGGHLNKRLTALRAVQKEIEPDWDEYTRIHAELDQIAQQITDDATRARVLMLTWIRAHQSLSTGFDARGSRSASARGRVSHRR